MLSAIKRLLTPGSTRAVGDDAQFLRDWYGAAGSSISNAGQPVNYHTALSVPAVFQCISLISGDVAKLPLQVMAKDIVQGRMITTPAPEHPVQSLLDYPNDDVNSVTFWRRFVQHYLLWGNAFIVVDRQREWMANLLPDRTGVYWDYETQQRYYLSEVSRGVTGVGAPNPNLITLAASEVVHVEWLQDVSWIIRGYETLHAMRNMLGLALAQNEFASEFFKQGGRTGGVLELPAAMKKQARDNVEIGFRKTYENTSSAFKTVILRDGARFHSSQVTPEGAQMVEAGEAQARQVARFFNLPPGRLGLSDSVSYNSKTEDNRNYLDNTLQIILTSIEAELDRRLLLPGERARYCIRFDVRQLLRLHGMEQANYLTALKNANLMTVNEGRAQLNLPPVPDGDDLTPPAPEPVPVAADDEPDEETETEEETANDET